MLVSAFHYDLPEELIAQHPPATRGASRMLILSRRAGAFEDHLFADLPQLLAPGDLLVLNDSRVLPARLYATRAGLHTQRNSPDSSGLIEILLTEHIPSPEGHNDWRALVRPAKKVQPGETLLFWATDQGAPSSPAVSSPAKVGSNAPELTATVLSAANFGERILRFAPTPNFIATVERIGHMPLPPYIHRDKHAPDTPEDRERYQTVYATPFGLGAGFSPRSSGRLEEGASAPASLPEPWPPDPGPSLQASAAAPTAGLHFTPHILAALEQRGIELAYITLHVGLGTFQPVRVADTRDIHLHAESYTLSPETAHALNRAHRDHRRIVAVGTTTTRTLEHLARTFESAHGPLSATNLLALEPHSSSTSLFLSPPPDGNAAFKLVRGLLTNFHLPESTLLMLVSAFAGREAVLRAYAHAVAAGYRFFSYGDCMLIL
ncbi:MAG TPA: S-adenosylmethionine:tRNA ribosyltransferase-isomerase [Acidobacteriaceae bacterium]|jgi:S-adenosylmethionine:tRNA ribosyltransferase-isomerase|nr:S-adenosylmethionine:tRNA ribosyltransferase-isomerase [Acidobacteriaceae bacterium]